MYYKYRPFNKFSREMLTDRMFYFSDPEHFNDPIDCKINIYGALGAAVDKAVNEESNVKCRLQKLLESRELESTYKDIENKAKHAGVFCLSKNESDMLMWSHYADSHKGFVAGFELSSRFIRENKKDRIIGGGDVFYSEGHPFVYFFIDIAARNEAISYDDFCTKLLSSALVVKSVSWEYEREFRIIRRSSGKVEYSYDELKVIIFGLNMNKKYRRKIIKILTGKEWKHVEFKEVVRKNDGFRLEVVDYGRTCG